MGAKVCRVRWEGPKAQKRENNKNSRDYYQLITFVERTDLTLLALHHSGGGRQGFAEVPYRN